MSCFLKSNDTSVSIIRISENDGITYYEIEVKVGIVKWTVKHRYNEFCDLHDKLVLEQSLSKDLLPPKKVIGNKSPAFLEKRKIGLEKYLKEVLNFLHRTMPREFVEFLDFHKYDVLFLLQGMANNFFINGDLVPETYSFSVLELFCISERLTLPCPPAEYCDMKYDFSHVLDFCSKLNSLFITPFKSIEKEDTNGHFKGHLNEISKSDLPIGTSTIIAGKLKFELSVFKELKTLTIYEVCAENIYHLGTIRKTLETLRVHKTSINQLNKILLCDDVHRDQLEETIEEKQWKKLKEANFRNNKITSIDESIKLLPNISSLCLDQNNLTNISNLIELSFLSSLSLCENLISVCTDWHLELGNLISLNLSQNQIKSLSGFKKLFSLVNLDVSCNLIDSIDEVDYISKLPCLENLRLTGNPVAGSVDYRPRVLSRFGERANEIFLDNEIGNHQELDTALVLSALRISKENSKQKSDTTLNR